MSSLVHNQEEFGTNMGPESGTRPIALPNTTDRDVLIPIDSLREITEELLTEASIDSSILVLD